LTEWCGLATENNVKVTMPLLLLLLFHHAATASQDSAPSWSNFRAAVNQQVGNSAVSVREIWYLDLVEFLNSLRGTITTWRLSEIYK
jgi:hypothetical protein